MIDRYKLKWNPNELERLPDLRENDKYLSCLGGILLTLDLGITSHIKLRGFDILSGKSTETCIHDVNHTFDCSFVASPLNGDRSHAKKHKQVFSPPHPLYLSFLKREQEFSAFET